MVLVDGSEHGVDVLVSDRDANVVLGKELIEELAQLTSIEESIAIIIVLSEVLLHFFDKL